MRTSLKLPGRAVSWLGGLFLLVLTLFAYAPAMRGGFIWDDDLYAANPMLAQPDGLRKIWTLQKTPETYYREFPVVYTTFWLERRLWGLEPAGFHLVNIILHVLNAILAWRLLKRLGLRWAWLAAAIFALHPAHLESVAWIAERKNVLSGFFYLLALGSYLEFEEAEERGWYAASLLSFALALLSKSVTCTFPVVVLLLRWRRGLDIRRRDVQYLLPFFLLALGMGLFTLWVEAPQGSGIHLSTAQRILLACRTVWFYPMKLAWPANLTFSYERWTIDTHAAIQWLWAAAVLGAGALMWKGRHLLGRGFLAGTAFYVLTLSPVLGLIDVYTFRYSFVADHYQYLASLGLIAMFVGGLTKLLGRGASFPRSKPGILASAVLLSLLVMATRRQARVYKDSETVWRDVLEKNPASVIARNNLGGIFLAQRKNQDAIGQYDSALQADPRAAMIHYNLGLALAGQGKLDEAIRHYSIALQAQPDFPAGHDSLGLALAGQGKLDEAIRHYSRALQAQPDFASAHLNMGVALAMQGKPDAAARQYSLALSARPNWAAARVDMGLTLVDQGKIDEAIRQYRLALEAQPEDADAHNDLGIALDRKGEFDESIRHFRRALQINPDYRAARDNLAIALKRHARN